MNKIKKLINNNRNIRRIHLSGTNYIVIEEIDDNKEIFFTCVNVDNDKIIFKDLQLKEKNWVGIEQIYYDKIIFHFFQTPEMPYHKGILVYDIKNNAFLWENTEESFLFIHNDLIYTSISKMLGNEIKGYNITTGEIVDNLGFDEEKALDLSRRVDRSYLYKNYSYPYYIDEIDDEHIIELTKKINNKYSAIFNETEILLFPDKIIFGLQIPDNTKYKNLLLEYDKNNNEMKELLTINYSNKIVKSSYFAFFYEIYAICDGKILYKYKL
ncbi:MAG TPA: DUF4905 domain-containing protein [Ignavibacteriales bacterium]|nr:DUF4905 domain-containing protein [Ignavibacteriales bacterium]